VRRAENQKVWYYKLRPSAVEGQYQRSKHPFKIVASYLEKENLDYSPNQLRWKPIPSVKEGSVNFVQGLVSLMGAGEPSLKQGISIYAYSANASMGKTAFYNSDGDFLIVPHRGTLFVRTLNGRLVVKPKEILIIPRGIKFSVDECSDITSPSLNWDRLEQMVWRTLATLKVLLPGFRTRSRNGRYR